AAARGRIRPFARPTRLVMRLAVVGLALVGGLPALAARSVQASPLGRGGEVVGSVARPDDPASPSAPSLRVLAGGSGWVRLAWSAPAGTARIILHRDGLLIDAFLARGAPVYTDRLLWPGTAYVYEFTARGRDGDVLASLSVRARTADRPAGVSRPYDTA